MPDDTDKKRRQEEEMIKTMLMSIVFSFPLLFLLDFICVIRPIRAIRGSLPRELR
jgi:hypothetical protein